MDFFDIHSVVIIGASESEGKIGNDLLKNLGDFKGKVYGVNPKGGKYKGIEFHNNIQNIPVTLDVAVFAIPAKFVAENLRECGKKGVKRAIIISAGFKEIGNSKAEEELIHIAKQYNMRLLGPNCLGYIDTSKSLNLSFGGKEIKTGNIAMISQSGAMAVAFTDWAYEYGVGFSKIISMGNKADLCENDFLQELAEDKDTHVIALYLESMEKGRAFYEIAKEISKHKPVIIVKSGMSERGSVAAASHTGALASSSDVLLAAFSQSGLHFTNKLEEFFLWGQAFSATRDMQVPDEMVVVTNAGGPGVMMTDHSEIVGIKMAEFNTDEQSILKQGLPDAASVNNPIDVIGDATSTRYEQVLQNILKLKRNLAICILLTPQTVTDVDMIAQKIISFKKSHPDILIMTSFMGGYSLGDSRERLESAGVLHYDYPKKAAVVFSRLIQQRNWEAKKNLIPSQSLIGEESLDTLQHKLQNQKTKLCDNKLMSEILKIYGIATTKEYLVKSHEEVIDVFSSFSSPIVAKISSPDIAHKTDVGGIIADINTPGEATHAYDTILARVAELKPDARIEGVVFQAQIPKSREIFVGFKRDESFGDILILGRGGIYVNVYNDVQRGLLPLTVGEIHSMLKNLQITPILEGVRGEKTISFSRLSETIHSLSQVFMDLEDIVEIDINPILTNDTGAIVVDAKFYL